MTMLSCRALAVFAVLTVYFTAEVTSVDFILVADFGSTGSNGTIYRAPMADLDQFVPIPLYGLVHPSALDYNPVTESIYWSDYSEDSYTIQPSISKANLDGTGQVILQQGTGEAAGLTVDYVANEIYWVERNQTRIRKASSLGPSGATTVVYTDLTNPHDIAVDPIRRELYWTDWGQPDDPTNTEDPPTFTISKKYPKIEKSNLDGTNRRILIDGKDHPGIVEPYGITLDFENELLYFCDPRNNSIYLSDLHGYGLHNLVEIVSPEIKPYDLAFYGSSIIWTDISWPALIEIERYQGLYAQLIGPFIFTEARGIYINTDTDMSCSSNPCQNGGLCRQFVEGYECVCSGSFTGDRCEIQSDDSCMSNPCSNDAECNQLMAGFTCLCKTGFSGDRCDHRNLIIIADIGTDKIYTATLPVKRGSTYEEIPIPNNTTVPKALDFDPVTQRVYWSDNFAIQSINLDGSDQRVIINLSEMEEVQGLALDTLNRKIYWTDIGKQTIEQSHLDGSNRTTIVSNINGTGEQVIGKPWNIIVDPAGGFIYWTDVAKEKHLATIERARLDGSGRVTLLPANLFEPVAIQADFSVSQLFIGDALVNRIETCDLDGRNRRVLIQLRQTDANPFDIGLYQNILYWSDSNLSRLAALNRYGSTDGALLVGPAIFNETGGMVIYEESDSSCDSNPCNGGRCRQLPLGYQCVCTATVGRQIGENCEMESDNSCGSNPCQNGARCDQKVSGHECICLYGFSGENCGTEDVLFIADQSNGTIYKAPLRTLTFQPILESLPSPTALRYDLKSNYIYWTDNITRTIERANATDGSDRMTIVRGLTNPGGLSIDRAERKLYWSDIGDHSINRIDMDRDNPVQEVFTQDVNLEKPQHIAVDWRNSQVYWTNWQDPVRIERMFTNKTGRETVINATNPNIAASESPGPWMVQPSGINIDYSDEILYWGDLNLTKISTFDLNTGEQRVLVDRDILTTHLNLVLPYDVVSYNEYLYWTDPDNVNASLVEINRRWPVALSVGSVEFGRTVGLDISTALPACWAKPCKNEGDCFKSSDQDGSYFCRCTPGYTGVHCQTEINECLSSPCVNDGLCQDKVADYSCFCLPGYTGKNCETDIDECAQDPPPCLGGAICTTPDINDYQCACPSNICGRRCDLVCPPACDSNPCQNQGTCEEPVPQFYNCRCIEGTTGTMCETVIPPCESNPCQNSGTCSERRFRFGYDCTCMLGYDGENCEININDCINNQCMQGSQCIDEINGYSCLCVPGFTGEFCGDNIYECESNPCQYGGICHDRVNGYECDCAPYFAGLNCETPTRGCGDIDCQHGSECLDRGGGFVVCVCDPPYTGSLCEVIDACVTSETGNPCQNGGTCSTFGALYNCVCNPGWEGASCEIATDECRSIPCRNGGTCIDQELSYACECTKDWKGSDCTETVRVSQSCRDYPSPCQHSSSCEDITTGYVACRCAPGYNGEYCQINIDECLSLPCQNGGYCTDKINGFECICRDQFEGDTCEEVIDKGCRHPTFPGFLYPERIWYPRGSRVTFVCSNEYTQKGATDALCKDDGWSEEPPECLKSGASTSDPAQAVGIGIGISIVVFLIILIILGVALYVRSSRREPATDEVAIVGYSNQQAHDGTGFGEVHIGLPNNDMHAPVDSAIVPDDEPIIKPVE